MSFEKFINADVMRAEFLRHGINHKKSPSIRQAGKEVKVEFVQPNRSNKFDLKKVLKELTCEKLEELNEKVMAGYESAMMHAKRNFHDGMGI